MFVDGLFYGFRNLRRKGGRSLLTVISIAIGVTSVVLIGSIGEIGKREIDQELSSMGLGSIAVSADQKLTTQKMDRTDLQLLQSYPDVQSAVPIVTQLSTIRMRGMIANAMVWGISEENTQLISLETRHGRKFREADLLGKADVCLVDSRVAELFYQRENVVGKTMDLLLNGNYVSFEIVGVVSSGGNVLQNLVGDVIPSFVYLPYTTLQKYTGDNTFQQIAVTVQEGRDTGTLSQQLQDAVNRQHQLKRGFKASDLSKQKDSLNRLLEIVTFALSSIAAVSLVVAGLGIMTVMVVSVQERTREIGIKKSLGATQGMILSEFLMEALLLSLAGSLIGLLVGIGGVGLGCLLLGIQMRLNFQLLLLSILVSIFTGVIFGAYPALLAAKMRPVDALRFQ